MVWHNVDCRINIHTKIVIIKLDIVAAARTWQFIGHDLPIEFVTYVSVS